MELRKYWGFIVIYGDYCHYFVTYIIKMERAGEKVFLRLLGNLNLVLFYFTSILRATSGAALVMQTLSTPFSISAPIFSLLQDSSKMKFRR